MAQSNLKNAVKHWYLQIILGIFLIIFGGILFSNYQQTYATVTIIFVMAFLFSAIFDILFSVLNRSSLRGWGWSLLNGVISLIISIYLLSNLDVALEVLPLIFSLGILFRSITAFFLAFDLKSLGHKGWRTLLFVGLLGVIIGLITLAKPAIVAVYIVTLTALGFIFVGIAQIFYGIAMKNIKNKISE